ncbi:MAG: antirestriction protein ArdA [Pseudomonadota bacterium]
MTPETKETVPNIAIYVACLAAYNNGILHGKWIDANQPVPDICKDVRDMLKASPIEGAEEFAIHDYEGFEGAEIGEYTSIDHVVTFAAFIAEHDSLGAELINHFGGDLEEAKKMIEENYHGVFDSVAEFAEQLTNDTTDIPENLRHYIDFEKMGRDLEINDVLTIETGFQEVHIFWNR